MPPPPPRPGRCRTEIWVWKGVALHGGVAATVAGVALHCATKPASGHKFGCVCSYMAGHEPNILMTGHIGTNTRPNLCPLAEDDRALTLKRGCANSGVGLVQELAEKPRTTMWLHSGGRGCLGEGRLGVPGQVWEVRFLPSFPSFPRENSHFKKCLGERLEVSDILLPDIRGLLIHVPLCERLRSTRWLASFLRSVLGTEKVPQRNCVTKILPNVRANFLARFGSKPLFCSVMTGKPLELIRKFFGAVRAIFWLCGSFWLLSAFYAHFINSVQTRCIVKGEAQKGPRFWRFSGGFDFRRSACSVRIPQENL